MSLVYLLFGCFVAYKETGTKIMGIVEAKRIIIVWGKDLFIDRRSKKRGNQELGLVFKRCGKLKKKKD